MQRGHEVLEDDPRMGGCQPDKVAEVYELRPLVTSVIYIVLHRWKVGRNTCIINLFSTFLITCMPLLTTFIYHKLAG
jgi:hypothetical protein